MFIIAPTPVPLAFIDANSSGRSSSFSNSIVILSPPSPSGTLTLAFQWRSSASSNPSTPGINCAISAGSLITFQTTSPRRGEVPSYPRASPRHPWRTPLVQIPQTRCDGLQLSYTNTSCPPERSASWIAAHTQCMPPPPPSPMPFAPSGVNGDGDLDCARLERRQVDRVRHVVVVEVRRSAACRPRRRRSSRAGQRRCACDRRAVHLALDDLRVDPRAAVVHRARSRRSRSRPSPGRSPPRRRGSARRRSG